MKHPKDDFITYMAAVTDRLQSQERLGTAHVYRSTLNRINEFMEGKHLPFKDITPLWLQTFQNHLLKQMLNWNTVSTYMRMLRAVYYRAVDEGLPSASVQRSLHRYTRHSEACARRAGSPPTGEASPSARPSGTYPPPFHVALHAARHSFCRHRLHAPLRPERRHTDLPSSEDRCLADGTYRTRSHGTD